MKKKERERRAIQKEGDTREEEVYTHTREVLQSKKQDTGSPRRVEDKGWQSKDTSGKEGTEYSLSPAKT